MPQESRPPRHLDGAFSRDDLPAPRGGCWTPNYSPRGPPLECKNLETETRVDTRCPVGAEESIQGVFTNRGTLEDVRCSSHGRRPVHGGELEAGDLGSK